MEETRTVKRMEDGNNDIRLRNPCAFTFDALRLGVERSGFAPETLSGAVDPDVHGQDLVSLGELHVPLFYNFTQAGAGGRSHLIVCYDTPGDGRREAA